METAIPVILGVVAVLVLSVLVLSLRRRSEIDTDPIERMLREESRLAREESARASRELREELARTHRDTTEALLQTIGELGKAQAYASERIINTIGEMGKVQAGNLESIAKRIQTLTESNESRIERLRGTIDMQLQRLQEGNEKKLDQMRQTVDEKLQGTLERRLGESFKQVSERLEEVHRGLGEMQKLAIGVGDLKKVLSNVKTRGTWGEVQLGAMLEQILNPDQYAINVATKGAGERVEFAIKLPGQGTRQADVVWLPIDAKFPVEDYQRLTEAQENGDLGRAEAAGKQLENRVKTCAKDICEKYLDPPKTTDFGILFLPIEGLFAEVVRRTGLTETIQREFRVVIAGPTTLWSLLNSLQMGFRTLAIEKRSSEVWNLLAAVKTEWTKYGEVLDLVQKKLNQASDTLEQARVRSKAVGKKLKDVQELPPGEARALLPQDAIEDDVRDPEGDSIEGA